ncbi:methylmalonyl-CoA mutase C-terminal domain/subunit [Pseudaminobacter salicylatoxidans]|uniref:Methylmalonyl-CoA mutase C-terminal domain/subunit n=1 Tax=Pseudaminobacter salicylatoxidans TaxID=93369 RepID=A0A316C449_PSESE|nr:cobalamin B12-binding domain-containing protein [Pseudaminobacter salicylatoxidans]PWJ84480.1 methylmalonyl-CoA mutase C-terminal domain/subunit [Pseudaminobacter salicylatoxidans]
MKRPLRVVVAKPGLDGHDRGAKIIARAFRDAGFEVIYTGIFQTSEMIVRTVLEEDADILGLSILSGSHMHFAEEICGALREQAAREVLVIMGGILPPRDIPKVKEAGVAEVFGPGTPTARIVEYVREWQGAA